MREQDLLPDDPNQMQAGGIPKKSSTAFLADPALLRRKAADAQNRPQVLRNTEDLPPAPQRLAGVDALKVEDLELRALSEVSR